MATRNELRNMPAVEPNAAYWNAEYRRVSVENDAAIRNGDQARRLGLPVKYWNSRLRELRAIRSYLAGKAAYAEIAEAKANGTPIHIKSDKRNAFKTLCGLSTVDPDLDVVGVHRPDMGVENAAEYCADCVSRRGS